MRTLLIISVCLPLFLLSCHEPPDGNNTTPLPDAILINFIFKNEMQMPATVKIRHKYQWQWEKWQNNTIITDASTLYSNWSEEVIESGESKPIGVEKTFINDTNSTQEVSGFILLDADTAAMSQNAPNFFSSFDLKIETTENTIFVSDEEIYDYKIPDTKLCYVIISNRWGAISRLYTFKQGMVIKKTFSLPVTLILQSDGTFSIDHETVVSSDMVQVLSDYPTS